MSPIGGCIGECDVVCKDGALVGPCRIRIYNAYRLRNFNLTVLTRRMYYCLPSVQMNPQLPQESKHMIHTQLRL